MVAGVGEGVNDLAVGDAVVGFGPASFSDRLIASRQAVAPIPETGLGRAINDRLRRAAAPR